MTPREHQLQLLEIIDRVHPFDGATGPLPANLREAYLAIPRHGFVHRYRLLGETSGFHEITPENLAGHLPVIYRNVVQTYVDSKGEALPSSNSEPAFILRVLEQLDLRPGQRVLEVGSGGGWLSAIMGHAVGPSGKVTGIEIFPELAAQSRADLAALGVGNVEIVAGDGGHGWPAGAPFDRVIFTAGSPDLPAVFYDQVRDGGLLVAPFRNRGGGEDLLVLQKRGSEFVMRAATLAYFVPLTGEKGRGDADAPQRWDELPLWQELRQHPCAERKLWFGGPTASPYELLTGGFRRFLGKLEPDFVALRSAGAGSPMMPAALVFGLMDEAKRSLALFHPYRLTGYGAPDCFERCLAIYRLWCELGMPSTGGLRLVVRRADDRTPAPPGMPVCRGESTFIWSLPDRG